MDSDETTKFEAIVKLYAFAKPEMPLPVIPGPIRQIIIDQCRDIRLNRPRMLLEQMPDRTLCRALVTTWSLLFVKDVLGDVALTRKAIRV